MRKGIIITVRLKSTRLKEKVLRKVNGKVVLKYLTDRLRENFDGDIIICTSTHTQDTPLVTFAKEEVRVPTGSRRNHAAPSVTHTIVSEPNLS